MRSRYVGNAMKKLLMSLLFLLNGTRFPQFQRNSRFFAFYVEDDIIVEIYNPIISFMKESFYLYDEMGSFFLRPF